MIEKMITNLNELCECSLAARLIIDIDDVKQGLKKFDTYFDFLDYIYGIKSKILTVLRVYCWDLKLISDSDYFSISDEINDLFDRLISEYRKKHFED